MSFPGDSPLDCILGKHVWGKWQTDHLSRVGPVFIRLCENCDEIEVKRQKKEKVLPELHTGPEDLRFRDLQCAPAKKY